MLLFVLICVLPLVSPVIIQGQIDYRKRRRLAVERTGESICTFVRTMPFRGLDTRVIRAVYSIQKWVIYLIRPTDTFEEYGIVDEDLENFGKEVADLVGRDLTDTEANPYYGRVTTPEMLIRFLCAQPRLPT